MLTKKHFEAIAQLLNTMFNDDSDWVTSNAIYSFANYLATQNPNFDRERFIHACLK